MHRKIVRYEKEEGRASAGPFLLSEMLVRGFFKKLDFSNC